MKKTPLQPPALFLRFFRWFCHPRLRDHIEGDLVEQYREECRVAGKRKAGIKFSIEVLRLFRPGIIKPWNHQSNSNPYTMYKSYLKTGWRNLARNKGYALINVTGLAAGMTVAMLIGLWITDELLFDSYFSKRDNIAQMLVLQSHEGNTYTGISVAVVVADVLHTQYSADFKAASLVSWDDSHVLSVGNIHISGVGRWVQSDFPVMFTLDMLQGNSLALKDPSTTLISRSLAQSLFGSEDPMGKSIRIDSELDLMVGGVYQDLPANTSFAGTKFLLPWANTHNWMNKSTAWDDHNCQLFVELPAQADLQTINKKIAGLPTPHIQGWKEELMLYPMKKIHLYSDFGNGSATGYIRFVWLFGTIGVFVLMLACINFMNLSTARSEKRAKEVGVRKTIGSMRSQLVGQFLTESVLVAGMALVLALAVTQLSMPFFNLLANKSLSVPWGSPLFWAAVAGFTLFAGILSGSYPAFYLSSFRPVKVLKGTFKAGRLASLPRKMLVVVQFTITIALITGTLVVFQQINFAKDIPVGYSRRGLITVPISTPEIGQHLQAIQADLMQTGMVGGMAASSHSPAQFFTNTAIEWAGSDPQNTIFFRNVNVTHEFGKTIGWTILQGRDFSADRVGDSTAVILNAKAAEVMRLKDPIGETITWNGKTFTIIGVVDNMVTRSPYAPIEPGVFFMQGWLSVVNIRVKPDASMHEAIGKIGAVFRKHNPNAPFEYTFVDDQYAQYFADEERVGQLAGLFSALAVFISCLGLSGLASFVAEQRTKELGIRKTMGASVASLWGLLSKDFVVLVAIAFVIAVPLAFVFMNNWLAEYHHHTTLSIFLFISVGLGALFVALLTVSYQAIRAAIANPVKSLRSE